VGGWTEKGGRRRGNEEFRHRHTRSEEGGGEGVCPVAGS